MELIKTVFTWEVHAVKPGRSDRRYLDHHLTFLVEKGRVSAGMNQQKTTPGEPVPLLPVPTVLQAPSGVGAYPCGLPSSAPGPSSEGQVLPLPLFSSGRRQNVRTRSKARQKNEPPW